MEPQPLGNGIGELPLVLYHQYAHLFTRINRQSAWLAYAVLGPR